MLTKNADNLANKNKNYSGQRDISKEEEFILRKLDLHVVNLMLWTQIKIDQRTVDCGSRRACKEWNGLIGDCDEVLNGVGEPRRLQLASPLCWQFKKDELPRVEKSFANKSLMGIVQQEETNR